MNRDWIPFNRPHVTGAEFDLIREAIAAGHLSGNGPFARRCGEWLEREIGSAVALLTPSCTAALEMSAMLADVGPGDEVIMPSFTFVSTANAFVLRGGVPVFVDIREDTLNLDERLVESAITDRTKAIVPVHYAGVGCDMEALVAVARRYGLWLIEDAAQGICARRAGRPLGSLGDLAALSFHETKNVHCGEGGALLINDEGLIGRAEILQEKGTDRQRFFRGDVDKYTWVDIGSSYVMSDISAAFLFAQLERAQDVTRRRLEIWHAYHASFEPLERQGVLRRPVVPDDVIHNAHMYYVLLSEPSMRDGFICSLRDASIQAVSHYVPLHSARAGASFGRVAGALPVTEAVSERLVRLPLWPDMTSEQVERVIDAVTATVASVAAH